MTCGWSAAGFESTLDFQSQQLIAEKRRIAEAAFEMIGDTATIYIDEGSTCLLVAERLQRSARSITVITPSLAAAVSLAEVADFDAIVTDRGLTQHEAQRYARLGPTVDRV